MISFKIAVFLPINVAPFQDELAIVVEVHKFTDERLLLEIIRTHALDGPELTIPVDEVIVVVIKKADGIAGFPLVKYGIVLDRVDGASKRHGWHDDDERYDQPSFHNPGAHLMRFEPVAAFAEFDNDGHRHGQRIFHVFFRQLLKYGKFRLWYIKHEFVMHLHRHFAA